MPNVIMPKMSEHSKAGTLLRSRLSGPVAFVSGSSPV